MKSEYNEAAERMKEMLIREYVKSHPGVSESQVVVRSVNGKAVCDTIGNLLSNCSGTKSTIQRELDHEALQAHLDSSEDQRYQSCLASIQSSQKLIDYLLTSPYTQFGEVEKKNNLDYLDRLQKISASRTQTVHYIKKAFMQMMEGTTNPTPVRVKSEITKYFKAVLDQLKAQGGIYKREFKLGNGFCSCVLKQMKTMLPQVKSQLDAATKRNVKGAYLLVKSEESKEAELNTENYKALKGTVDNLQVHLGKRQTQFTAIEKVVAFLEELVQQLEKAKVEQKPKEEPKPKKGRGMAFAAKLFGGGKRR